MEDVCSPVAVVITLITLLKVDTKAAKGMTSGEYLCLIFCSILTITVLKKVILKRT